MTQEAGKPHPICLHEIHGLHGLHQSGRESRGSGVGQVILDGIVHVSSVSLFGQVNILIIFLFLPGL